MLKWCKNILSELFYRAGGSSKPPSHDERPVMLQISEKHYQDPRTGLVVESDNQLEAAAVIAAFQSGKAVICHGMPGSKVRIERYDIS